MYLSYLLIDTEADPAHPRPGRTWVRNPYRVHQRLCMAFPSLALKGRDPHFLAPLVPTQFSPPVSVSAERDKPCHVHLPRAEDTGFLFRIDPCLGRGTNRHVVIVQSSLKPDWDYAFHNAPEFLVGVNRVDPFDPKYAPGTKLRFWLRANPTKRLRCGSLRSDGTPIDPKWIGKRVALYGEDEQRKWLERHAEQCGFRVAGVRCNLDGLARSWKGEDRITLASVRFEGTLKVTNPEAFRNAVIAGIGPGKGLGFGLLSVVPAAG